MREDDWIGRHKTTGRALWIAIVSVASILFSLALASATPLAKIATIAGTQMSARGALLLTGAAWLANQLVGYLVLGYPTTWDSLPGVPRSALQRWFPPRRC